MTTRPPDRPSEHRRVLYGRRRGRPLHRGQQALVETLLPRLAVTLPAAGTLDPATLFDPRPDEVWLEIGFGSGEHLAAFENGVAKLLADVQRRALANVRILTDDARLLIAALPSASIGRVFILFPDPWPKQRHHKRRIVAGETLAALAAIMTDGAELRLATDDLDYLAWMLARVPAHPAFAWLADRPSDWRVRPTDWPATRYEAKAIAAGRRPYFLRFRRRAR